MKTPINIVSKNGNYVKIKKFFAVNYNAAL